MPSVLDFPVTALKYYHNNSKLIISHGNPWWLYQITKWFNDHLLPLSALRDCVEKPTSTRFNTRKTSFIHNLTTSCTDTAQRLQLYHWQNKSFLSDHSWGVGVLRGGGNRWAQQHKAVLKLVTSKFPVLWQWLCKKRKEKSFPARTKCTEMGCLLLRWSTTELPRFETPGSLGQE